MIHLAGGILYGPLLVSSSLVKSEDVPNAFQNTDRGVISYGKHQATLASNNLGRVLTHYWERSQSETAKELKQTYVERVADRDETLRNDSAFKLLLLSAAEELEMEAAQDAVFESNFYQPAVEELMRQGLRSPLALACLYDTRVQGGLAQIISATLERVSASTEETSEEAWLAIFLQIRLDRLFRLADAADGRGESLHAQALRNSAFRVEVLQGLLHAGNLPLEGEFSYSTTGPLPAFNIRRNLLLDDCEEIVDSHSRS